jgi:hypothetical protein
MLRALIAVRAQAETGPSSGDPSPHRRAMCALGSRGNPWHSGKRCMRGPTGFGGGTEFIGGVLAAD